MMVSPVGRKSWARQDRSSSGLWPRTGQTKGNSMKTFEFQFRWGGKHRCFGIDVNAVSIEEAVTKANGFFDSDDALCPVNHPDAERVWVNVTTPVTARNLA